VSSGSAKESVSKVVGFEDDYEPVGRSLRTRKAARKAGIDDGAEAEDADDVKLEIFSSEDEFVQEEDHVMHIEDDYTAEEGSSKENGSRTRKSAGGKRKVRVNNDAEVEDINTKAEALSLDDGVEKVFQARLQNWCQKRKAARELATGVVPEQDEDDEWHMPHPTVEDLDFGNGYKLPGDIGQSLVVHNLT